MRKALLGLATAAAMAFTTLAHAELQNVTIDGSIQIRYNYYRNVVASPTGLEIRWPGNFLPKRPIGDLFGGQTVTSPVRWARRGNDLDYVEHRTRLGVQADFTNNVSSYIEFDNYHIWGDDFRANWITGADMGPVNDTNINLYQAYVQADEMWGVPLSLRIGRQEMEFGSGWLVGTNNAAPGFTGLSFDGIRASYGDDLFSVDVFASQLFENSPVWQDDNVTFSGVYASYHGLDELTLDAYWLWLRDPRPLADTNFIWFVEWLENLFGVDNYDTHNIHTVGLRGAGEFQGLDYEAEVAYQWGDAPQVGFLFRPFLYGDDSAKYSNWAAHGQVGYTFDMQTNPRVFVGGAYYGGEDNRSINFWQWLNPFYRPKASVSFNRLFSDTYHSEFFLRDMSNVWLVNGGVSVEPTEELELELVVSYFRALNEFRAPAHFRLGRYRVPIAPALSFWDRSNSRNLGWEVALYATYNYTEDLQFSAGWSHLFTGSGLEDGSYIGNNALSFVGGRDSKDADYVFVETKLSF